MLDHVGFPLSDFAAGRAFYNAALAPLGVTPLVQVTAEQNGGDTHIGYGADDRCFFWIADGHGPVTAGPMHVCFTARNRAMVDAFYAAAIAAGGRDNGAPGIRAHYHKDYYAAFVLDPDGRNIEAVCHTPV
jgi:catechol 2,3-dioxygenase-like lactoylglutathione lyase family enzyme